MKKNYKKPKCKFLVMNSSYGLLDETMSYSKSTISNESDIGFSKEHDADEGDAEGKKSLWED